MYQFRVVAQMLRGFGRQVVMNNQIRLPKKHSMRGVMVEVKFPESDDTEWTAAGLQYPANQPSTLRASPYSQRIGLYRRYGTLWKRLSEACSIQLRNVRD
jgi:hypothetical protein